MKASALAGTAGSPLKTSDQPLNGLVFFDIDLLNPEAKKFVEDCQRLLAERLSFKLTCLGCYKSSDSWDYRPLFVAKSDQNMLLLFRIIKPDSKLNPTLEMAWRNLSSNLSDSYLASGLDDFSHTVTTSRIYWSLRKFYSATLDQLESDSSINKSTLVRAIDALFSEIKQLEERLCPHGNLCASNIGFDGQKLFIIDPWIHSSSKKSASQNILGPRSLASLLLRVFAQSLPEAGSQALIKFISHDSEAPSFSDLHASWQSVNTKENDLSYNAVKTSEQSLMAPRGRVIKSSELNTAIPKDTVSKVSPENIQPEIKAVKKIDVRNNRSVLFFGIALVTAIFVLFASGYLNFQISSYSEQQLADDWSSDDPQILAELAKSAIVDKDRKVQQFLSLQLLSGENKQGVDSRFLKMAFNPLWFEELSDKDRVFALSAAFSAVYKTPSEALPKLEQLHPALIFSLLGKLRLDNKENSISRLGIEKLLSLPGSYGAVFKGLSEIGFKKLGDLAVHASARILNDNFDETDIRAILSSDLNDDKVLQITSLIAPFSETNPKIAEMIFEYALPAMNQLGSRLRWFAEEPLADWKSVEPKDLLFIALGLVPDTLNQTDKLADLLLFPNQRVRQKAHEKILVILKSPELSELFNMPVVNPTILSRAQIISLVAITQGEPQKAAPFVSSWLSLEPDPAVVLEFLLGTSDRKSFEASTVQLANYLARKDFDISQRQLPLLLSHPEPLARTLAFPRLDPSKELDRRILTAWLETETSPRIKSEIKLKLGQK